MGEYDADRADNVGLGYWSHNFRGTVLYFPLENPGILLSASMLHEINSEKEGFDLRPAPPYIRGVRCIHGVLRAFHVRCSRRWHLGDR
ncbi:transporter [bacterium]|nr:transporter [candidate division CSSED10-310 bacterium]